jgi:hypothetical protein
MASEASDIAVAVTDGASMRKSSLARGAVSASRRSMRSLVIVVALAGCTESDADQLADLKAQVGLSCWKWFSCENGGQSACAGPATPVADGVACMNDAVASGDTAMASWGVDIFNPWETREIYLFAIDHEVRAFLSIAPGPDPARVREIHGCTAPLTVTTGGAEPITVSGCSIAVPE